MEWDEFTGFIINMAMANPSDHFFADHWASRATTSDAAAKGTSATTNISASSTLSPLRATVLSMTYIPQLTLLAVCCGPTVSFFDPSNSKPAKGIGDKHPRMYADMPITATALPAACEANAAYRNRLLRGEDPLSCLATVYMKRHECICTVTSDLKVGKLAKRAEYAEH